MCTIRRKEIKETQAVSAEMTENLNFPHFCEASLKKKHAVKP